MRRLALIALVLALAGFVWFALERDTAVQRTAPVAAPSEARRT
jgi:hypothetical protein